MKSITGYWSKCDRAGDVVKVMIDDKEAIDACNRNAEIGWTIKETVRDFNKFLEFFGFRITCVERWIGDYYA